MPFKLASYESCGFCQYVSGQLECASLAEDNFATALVNHRQYERGAALVITRAHRETILNVSQAEIASLYGLARRLARAMEEAFGACGVNVYQNSGIKAGQHVPHVHVHVVPRYATSDPERLFLQRDFPIVPFAEQRLVAAALRERLRSIA
jgi:histidine triad (HIT) family protein